jgi:hypothetical protein
MVTTTILNLLPVLDKLGENAPNHNSTNGPHGIASHRCTKRKMGITQGFEQPHRLTIQFKPALRRPCRSLPWSFPKLRRCGAALNVPYQQLMLSLSLVQTVCQPTSHGFGAYTHDETTADETWTGTHKRDQTRRADRIQSTVAAHMGMLQLEMDTIKVILKDPITNGESSSPIFEQWKRALIV